MDPVRYTVAVRELCEFSAKQGDLDLRFTPSPTAEEGKAGHKTVASRRGSTHRTEVAVSGAFRELMVRGRADGFDAGKGLLEEVKTYRGDLALMPANHRALHWAQAKVYGHLLCEQFGLKALSLSLVYFEIGSEQETPLFEECTADELRQAFERMCMRFLEWARSELEHRAVRDATLVALKFPHAAFRAGQRTLAQNTFRAATLGRCLLAQAPTGIGKTIATIFPLLKAAPRERLDKIFFLSAKGPGRALALDAVDALRRSAPALAIRVIELVARETACEHPDKACHGESCPLARGFYDRLGHARSAACAVQSLTRESLRAVALAHDVCPYYLSQEMVRWADVVIGDYNYYFDSAALLHGMTRSGDWRVGVLVDEAHNLVERARAMYSADLCSAAIREVIESAPLALRGPLGKLKRAVTGLAKGQADAYVAHEEVPQQLTTSLRDFVVAMSDHLAAAEGVVDQGLLRLYFDALRFASLADTFSSHSLFDVSRSVRGSGPRRMNDVSVCIRNVTPAPFLRPRFASAHTAVLFSATLSPQHFYADTLGLPEDAAWLDVESPFTPDQLEVRVVTDVSTRFNDRERTLAKIVQVMAVHFEQFPGNYFAFFSSFEYARQAFEAFSREHPHIRAWCQRRGMDAQERTTFLAHFEQDGSGIGFAVLGGAFSEGIDLPGSRLVGAFVATLGLPQVNRVNEEMKRRLDLTAGDGYGYMYLYPGIRKVVQAAGRVIRTTSDRGHLFLIDDRFARPAVQRLLPAWWRIRPVRVGLA
jgi:DNA excision repair protein ERCC-2